ncbi:hypothetical protein [Streptococcus agalactiae]|uniref:hypothetical protein n=1 Tax=Streptococcus agalactiae TaxID=1311 RepID=UPI003F172ADD
MLRADTQVKGQQKAKVSKQTLQKLIGKRQDQQLNTAKRKKKKNSSYAQQNKREKREQTH